MGREKHLRKAQNGLEYVPARLVEAKRWYIEYWQWSWVKEKIVRRRFFNIKGDTKAAMRKDARLHIYAINKLLYEGHGADDPPAMKMPVEQEKEKPLTVKEAIELGRDIKCLGGSKSTLTNYTSYTKYFLQWAEKEGVAILPITALRQDHIFAFLDSLMNRGLKARSRNNYRDFLAGAINALIKRGYLLKNPCEGVENMPTESSRHIPFTPEEKELMEAYLLKNMPELFLFTRLIYYGFMRPVEIIRMKVKHIDFRNRIIITRAGRTKNKKQLPIVINPQLNRVLLEMGVDKMPGELHPFSINLKPGPAEWNRNRVSELHSKALKETGLYNGELDLYGWKHTGVCNAYYAGVDAYSIMKQCRHHSLQETEKYMTSMGLRISKELKNKEW